MTDFTSLIVIQVVNTILSNLVPEYSFVNMAEYSFVNNFAHSNLQRVQVLDRKSDKLQSVHDVEP